MEGSDPSLPGNSPLSLTLLLRFTDSREASRVFEALKVDDDGFVNTRLEDDTIRADFLRSNPLSIKRAVDDYLACAVAAEGALRH